MSLRSRSLARVVIRIVVFATCTLLAVPPVVLAYTPHHPGRWTEAMAWNEIAIHVALLRGDMGPIRTAHSRILWWGGSVSGNQKQGLWDWRLDQDRAPFALTQNVRARTIPQPPFDIFCSGHSLLPNGDLFITGGHEGNNVGLTRTAIFDRDSLEYHERAQMSRRRWYPTNVPLAHAGKTLVVSGSEFNRMVVFGGRNIATGTLRNSVDTYQLTNAGAWETPQTLNPEPTAREGHAMAGFAGGASFVFGGVDADGYKNDVWKLDEPEGVTQNYFWIEFQITNPVTDVAPRKWSTLIAPHPDTLIVFGGQDSTGAALGDGWWLRKNSGGTHTWFTPSGTPPSARYGHTMVFSPSKGRAYLFGGKKQDGSLSDELWTMSFIGGTTTWQQITKAGGPLARPRARWLHAMAADEVKRTRNGTGGWSRVFVFGGDTTACSGELWEMWIPPALTDSVEWVKLTPSNPPSARRQASLVFNHEEQQLILFGGETDCSGSTGDATVRSLRLGGGGTPQWESIASNSVASRGHGAIYEHRPIIARIPELYDPITDQFTDKPSAELTIPYYPFLFSDTTGSYVFHATAGSRRLTLPSYSWQYWPSAPGRWPGHSAVRFRPGRVMKSGESNVAGNTEWMEMGSTTLASRWRASINKMHDRTHHNLTMLPTGEVIATGGEHTPLPGQESGFHYVKRPEIWNPDAVDNDTTFGEWYGYTSPDTLNASGIQRDYHSTGILLPDARVLCTGGYANATLYKTADLYSPPYLFSGVGDTAAARPALDGVQEAIVYGQAFSLRCKDPIVQAVLVRPGAVTHSFNQDQRWIPLTPTGSSDTPCRQFLAPADSNIAPHGDYLLFVLNAQKVPSMGHWVRLGNIAGQTYSTCDSLRPSQVVNLHRVCHPTNEGVKLRWTAPKSDSSSGGATQLYELRYRLGAGMSTMIDYLDLGTSVPGMPTPSPPGQLDSVIVTGLNGSTPYHFRLIARDGAAVHRNWSAMSNALVVNASVSGCGGGGGGCCQEDDGLRAADRLSAASESSQAASGFENSLAVATAGTDPAVDVLRLEGDPRDAAGRIRAHVTALEGFTIDRARMLVVDHPLDQEALAGDAGPVVGRLVDVLAIGGPRGSGSGFVADVEETLAITLPAGATHLVIESRGIVGPPAQSGILIEGLEGGPRTYQPRRNFERRAFGPAAGPLRLTFKGSHEIGSIAALVVSAGQDPARALVPVAANHSAPDDTLNVDDEIALVPGDRVDFEFIDGSSSEGGIRRYFLEIMTSGASIPSPIEMALISEVPSTFRFGPARPNPVLNSTTLHFGLPVRNTVRIDMFDLAGRRVRTLTNAEFAAGHHSVTWDRRDGGGRHVAPGIYLCRMLTPSFRQEIKLVVTP